MSIAAHTCSANEIRVELHRILGSVNFLTSDRNRRFLEYVVEETLGERAARLKGYNIATIVFGRPDDFDPQLDPVVRIEARRIRRALEHFYLVEGYDEAKVCITVPTGGYVPDFQKLSAVVPPPAMTSTETPGASILVEAFDGGGDPAALLNLDRGFARQVVVVLHQLGERVVFALQPGRLGEVGVAEGNSPVQGDVLIGDISVAGDAMSVSAILKDGSTGRVLWGKTFGSSFVQAGILATRDELAACVAREVHAFVSARAGEVAQTRAVSANGHMKSNGHACGSGS